jgi:hypothetical protein
VCIACQESASADTGKQDPLLHCADLQGVVLGVGLTMLEQQFERRSQEQPEQVENSVGLSTRNSKRRKIDISSSHDVDDEDIVYYANVGKRQKGGIGYDGDSSEDVSPFGPRAYFNLVCLLRRLQVKLELWLPKGRKTK